MSERLLTFVQTDIGKKRNNNEDNFVWISPLWGMEGSALIGAIDGVGGYEGGEEAAQLAKDTIENYLKNFSAGHPLQLLKAAVIQANNAIYDARIKNTDKQKMSCVLSVAILDAARQMMYVVHVGDSRGYVYRNGQVLKVTSDHSTVGMQEDSGYLTEAEAMGHPLRNEINRMMGELLLDDADTGQYLQVKEHSFLPGDIALFCSDGLTDLVSKAPLAAVLGSVGTLKKKAQELINEANGKGGKDNITVALGTYSSKGRPGRKPGDKNIIEVPIEAPATTVMPVNNKKKMAWLLPLLAFATGFLMNWKGTGNFFARREIIKDSMVQPVITDTLQRPRDSLHGTDTPLTNATDTIIKDSQKKHF